SLNVLGVSEIKAAGIRKGQIVDIEEAVSAINSSLEGAERMAGYSVSRVITSIGGAHIESQNSKGVVAVATPEGEITKNDIERVIDAAKAVSLPSSREIIHVLPRTYAVDGQEGIKDPVGMTGVRLEVDTHIITASSTSLRNLEKALSEVGVNVDGVVFSGYASNLSVLSDTEKELGVVLVDVGAGTTDISIYVEGAVSYSSVLPVGARHITNDLAIGLRVSLESAEKIKLFLGAGSGESEAAEKTASRQDEIDLSELNLPEEVRKVSKKTLIDGIIRPRLNEIFTFVGLEIKKSGYGGQTPAGLVITGGGAKTIGTQESAKRMLAMPVRIAVPTGVKGIIDEIEEPSFATAVGLLRYGSKYELPKSLKSFIP
ncbi:MAG: cell division protein FtsA, partial [Candidatus Levybacteria bacterium]|nr:cell division protein FtsA [Candidatus Levybacteria bacterium]